MSYLLLRRFKVKIKEGRDLGKQHNLSECIIKLFSNSPSLLRFDGTGRNLMDSPLNIEQKQNCLSSENPDCFQCNIFS